MRELRIQKSWTQDILAEKIGVSRQTISLIERNSLLPSTIIALKIAKLFSEKVENLFILESNK